MAGGGEQLETTELAAELASLPAGSRHGVGRKLSGPEQDRTISPGNMVLERKKSPTGVVTRKVSPTSQDSRLSPVTGAPDRTKSPTISVNSERTKSPINERTKSPVEQRLSPVTDPVERKVIRDNPERRISSTIEHRHSLICDNNVELGARPRQTGVTQAVNPAVRKPSDLDSVVVKQSSWSASKWSSSGGATKTDTVVVTNTEEPATPTASGNSFMRRKDLWERRSMSNSTPSGDEKPSPGWNRTTPRVSSKTSHNTPDLVMDLPTGPLASSPPIPAPRPTAAARTRSPSSDSVSSSASSSSEAAGGPLWSKESPVARHTTADNFAAADTDTMRKHKTLDTKVTTSSPLPVFRTNILSNTPSSSLRPNSVSATKTLFSSPGTTPKPAVKVKPILQVKPSEIKKEQNNAKE